MRQPALDRKSDAITCPKGPAFRRLRASFSASSRVTCATLAHSDCGVFNDNWVLHDGLAAQPESNALEINDAQVQDDGAKPRARDIIDSFKASPPLDLSVVAFQSPSADDWELRHYCAVCTWRCKVVAQNRQIAPACTLRGRFYLQDGGGQAIDGRRRQFWTRLFLVGCGAGR